MSDDIPIIFTEEALRADRAGAPVAVFLSAAAASQMQQYAAGGWKVIAAEGFKSSAPVALADVPAASAAPDVIDACTLLSCEAPFLRAETSAYVNRWRPAFLKFNCAFHDVADAASLAGSLAGMGYAVAGAQWRDDNSFGYRSLAAMGAMDSFPAPAWDRMNLIGVRDSAAMRLLLSFARLYVGEERRIAELRVANTIRNDYIARLEDALMAHQQTRAGGAGGPTAAETGFRKNDATGNK